MSKYADRCLPVHALVMLTRCAGARCVVSNQLGCDRRLGPQRVRLGPRATAHCERAATRATLCAREINADRAVERSYSTCFIFFPGSLPLCCSRHSQCTQIIHLQHRDEPCGPHLCDRVTREGCSPLGFSHWQACLKTHRPYRQRPSAGAVGRRNTRAPCARKCGADPLTSALSVFRDRPTRRSNCGTSANSGARQRGPYTRTRCGLFGRPRCARRCLSGTRVLSRDTRRAGP